MRLGGQKRSGNVEDRRGRGGGGAPLMRMGLPGLAILIAAMLFFPDAAPTLMSLLGGGGAAPSQQAGTLGAPEDESGDFVAAVLGSVEDTWRARFAEGDMAAYGANGPYAAPTLVLFDGIVASGCGTASSATGPFYCPLDRKLYLDTSFFAELEGRLGAGGDFSNAYVIAHEVGHHVQALIGATDIPNRARSNAMPCPFASNCKPIASPAFGAIMRASTISSAKATSRRRSTRRRRSATIACSASRRAMSCPTASRMARASSGRAGSAPDWRAAIRLGATRFQRPSCKAKPGLALRVHLGQPGPKVGRRA